MPEKPLELPPPIVLAMIVSDAVHTDPSSGKHYLLGCFTGISSPEFPLTYPMLAVYVALTDGRGVVPFHLTLLDLEPEKEALFEVEGEIEFSSPRAEVELLVPDLEVSERGEYAVQLFVAEQFVTERRIVVS